MEPFSGTGTTELVCANKGISSFALEINPFLVWLGNAKLGIYHRDKVEEFLSIANTLMQHIDQNFPLGYNYSKLKYHCYLKLLDSLPVFCGFGVSVKDARMAVCKLAYEYLEQKDLLWSIRNEIENPNRDDSINQLEILARRGYFSIPTYAFEETYDCRRRPVLS